MYYFGAVTKAAPRVHCRYPANWVATRTSQLWRRNSATKSNADKHIVEKLPLAGIKVLDMTRVLAGVCDCIGEKMTESLTSISHTVLRYLEILGKSEMLSNILYILMSIQSGCYQDRAPHKRRRYTILGSTRCALY
jgi:hypothetical protein